MTIFGNTRPLHQNQDNFGLAKKPNREGNEHNFGWLRDAKGLRMNLSKGQAHITAKKHTNKPKRAKK